MQYEIKYKTGIRDMGGFFGVVSTSDCVAELFYGTDYHSHLGTRRGGMAMYSQDGSIVRRIHDITNAQFRSKFDSILHEFSGHCGIVKETADTWQLRCSKSKSNKEKDDPGKMDLVVSKKNYLPVSLTAKVKGITMTLRNFSIGVSKKEVTFNPSEFKGAKITDKRQ